MICLTQKGRDCLAKKDNCLYLLYYARFPSADHRYVGQVNCENSKLPVKCGFAYDVCLPCDLSRMLW